MASEWKVITPTSMGTLDLENYEATSDWYEFDCICVDKDAPNYENILFDFPMMNLGAHHFTCARCGRQYRVHAEVIVEMYEPLALRYPNHPDKMPAETLGLRTKE